MPTVDRPLPGRARPAPPASSRHDVSDRLSPAPPIQVDECREASTVRRDWLTNTFAHRKTAPAGAEAYLARVVTEGWGHERASSDALALAGFAARENVDPWAGAAEQRMAVTDALAAATPKRTLQIGLAIAVAMWETKTHPNTWRAADAQTVLTLARLQEWGYPVSDIEQRILTEADDRTDRD